MTSPSRNVDTTSQSFFDSLYSSDPDPWNFASDPHELARYDHVETLLEGRHFRHAFEPGCSVGELTCRLARHADRVTAIDISPVAATRAARRCAALDHVEVSHGRLPESLPEPGFDLLVLSEIGYYFEPATFTSIIDALLDRASDDVVVVGVHWTGESADHLVSGDEVHATLDDHPRLRRVHDERRPRYVVGTWTR